MNSGSSRRTAPQKRICFWKFSPGKFFRFYFGQFSRLGHSGASAHSHILGTSCASTFYPRLEFYSRIERIRPKGKSPCMGPNSSSILVLDPFRYEHYANSDKQSTKYQRHFDSSFRHGFHNSKRKYRAKKRKARVFHTSFVLRRLPVACPEGESCWSPIDLSPSCTDK